jgi:hypothetical protein
VNFWRFFGKNAPNSFGRYLPENNAPSAQKMSPKMRNFAQSVHTGLRIAFAQTADQRIARCPYAVGPARDGGNI